MASIFKNRKIKENLENFEIPNLKGKIKLVQEWYDFYYKGTLKQEKEITVAPRYSQLLIDLLDYKGKPDDDFTIDSEPTTEEKGGQRPDLLLGHLSGEDRNISAVVELKSASVPLDRPQRREGNMSPIQQAFKYKPQFSNCSFVIASNFYEIRLFQDTQLDYEIWTLDDLLNPEDNYFQFRKFYYLLCAQNFVAKTGKSKTEELLSDIRVESEKISKKFYKEYHELRTDLLRSMYQKNQVIRNNIDFGIEKAQKIIDRVVFVCFCEDTGLLPEHTLKRVLDNSKDNFGSLWSSLQGFFEAVDKGDEKLEVPDGYNGGLFKADPELRNLEVDDKILGKLLDLGKYDFSEDLTVNILGHIFEQSISDLEEIKQKVEKDKKINSKRKKDGIFYTPDYIVDYIVKNSLGKYLEEKEEELKNKYKLKGDITDKNYEKRERQAYEEYQDFLQKVKVLDPACGSGAFLVKVFDYLLAENQRVGAILGNLFGIDSYNKHILKNNIYGVDLNQESVEITKLSLWLKTAQKNKKLTVLDDNIKCGNSLIDDVEVAGDKAFDWGIEFKEIMGEGGFDVVVGNPPYGAKLSKEDQYFLKNKFNIGSTDTAALFIKLGFDLLNKEGKLGFIIPKSFSFSSNYNQIREYVWDNLNILVDCRKVWKEVKLEQVIIILDKLNKIEKYNSCILKETNIIKLGEIDKKVASKFGFFLNGVSDKEVKLAEKILEDSIYLNDISRNQRGAMLQQLIKDKGELDIIGGGNISRFVIKGIKGKINGNEVINEQAYINNDSVLVQNIIAHIENPVDHIKIIALLPQNNKYLILDTINQITVNEGFSSKYVWWLLNSELMNWYVYRFIYGKAIRTMHFDNAVTLRIPIKKISLEEQNPFITKADVMLDLNKKFQNKLDKFSSRISSSLNLEKLSNKLKKFYELDFVDFIKELKKKKVELSLKDQDEWEDYFNDYKKEVLELKSQIDKTDKEIDQMVYDLYGLTKKEVGVVEGGVK